MGIFKKLLELIFGKEEVSDVGDHYNPFYVHSLSSVDEASKYYVFNVTPPLSVVNGVSNQDRYYELHIKTIDFSIYYEQFLRDYIHVELMDNNIMEIYEGYFYEASYEIRKSCMESGVRLNTEHFSLSSFTHHPLSKRKVICWGLQYKQQWIDKNPLQNFHNLVY